MTIRNRKILITRQPEQSGEMIREIEQRGGSAVVVPMIVTGPPPDWTACDDAIGRLASFELLVFTSVNAVENFVGRTRVLGVSPGVLRGARSAAVGSATAAALTSCGFPVVLIPGTFSGASLAAAIGDMVRGKRVLLPRGSAARETVESALKAAGALVEAVTVYVTSVPEGTGTIVRRVLSGEFDVVTFASPSAAQHFARLFGPGEIGTVPAHTRIAVIGASTSDAVKDAGLPVDIIARESTARGLVESIDHYFS